MHWQREDITNDASYLRLPERILIDTLVQPVACTVISMLSRIFKTDSRLLGRWRSDKTETMAYVERNAGLSPDQLAKLADVYGKLEITFDQHHVMSRMDDWTQAAPYMVLSRGNSHCVIATFNKFLGRIQKLRFDFDADGMWETSDLKKQGLAKERFSKF
ncbi:hypothetical protein GC207_01995 [bacterium]|nr:hypothetical protein [bacterium]